MLPRSPNPVSVDQQRSLNQSLTGDLSEDLPGYFQLESPWTNNSNKNSRQAKTKSGATVLIYHKDSKMHNQVISKRSFPAANLSADDKSRDLSWSVKQLASHSCDVVVFQMSPKQVKVKFAFLTVGDVDTKSQRFVSEVLIQAKWTEPKLEGVSDVSLSQNFKIF